MPDVGVNSTVPAGSWSLVPQYYSVMWSPLFVSIGKPLANAVFAVLYGDATARQFAGKCKPRGLLCRGTGYSSRVLGSVM
jgi:hypothetical protein